MFKPRLPSGLDHSIHGSMLPDLQVSFRLFSAHRRKVDKHWSFPEHNHSLFEINIVLDGTQKMQVADKIFVQEHDSLLFILPGVKHASLGAVKETMEYFCLHFDTDDLWIRHQLNHFRETLYTADSPLVHQLRPMINELLEAATFDLLEKGQIHSKMLHAAFSLFSGLIEMAASHKDPSIKPSPIANLAARMAESIERIVLQSSPFSPLEIERIGIEKIAEQLGYSSAYCNRIFRSAYGISPRQFMTVLQLRQARLLLVDETLSIEQIALILGYQDIAHFSKQFKRWMNISPSAYRQLSH